jgi:hypothetical protein
MSSNEDSKNTPAAETSHVDTSTQDETAAAKSKKPTPKERAKQYLPLAKKLSVIVKQQKNIKHTPNQLKSWANEIRKLVENNGVSPDRIRTALDWYQDNAGGQYIPVIESGASLREKFVKLEDAIRRNGGNTRKVASSRFKPSEKYERYDRNAITVSNTHDIEADVGCLI